MTNSPWSHRAQAGITDDIDFEIKGQELQFVELGSSRSNFATSR